MASSGQARERSTSSGRARLRKCSRAAPPGAPQAQDQTDSDAQERLIAFLESPESYPHSPAEVRLMQTHISWVFIASPFVFKVKKPMELGFLDFSTLKKRRHFCERELKLNRRLAPEIYLDVVPIYKSSSGFSFNALFSTLRFRAGHTANCYATKAAKRTRDGKSSNSMSIFP